jgi:hypothetical protein
MVMRHQMGGGRIFLGRSVRLQSGQRWAWLIALGLGVVFLLVGLGVIAFGASLTTLTCERGGATQGSCTLTQQRPGRSTTRAIALEDLRGAEIESRTSRSRSSTSGSSRNRSRSSTTYRVVLLTTRGDIPLTGAYSSDYEAKQRLVDQLTAFLADGSARTLTLRQDNRAFGYALGGAFAAAGLAAVTGGVVLLRRRG